MGDGYGDKKDEFYTYMRTVRQGKVYYVPYTKEQYDQGQIAGAVGIGVLGAGALAALAPEAILSYVGSGVSSPDFQNDTVALEMSLADGDGLGIALDAVSLGVPSLPGGFGRAKNIKKSKPKGKLLPANLQLFAEGTGKTVDDIPWITPKNLPIDEEQAVINTMKHIENGTMPSGKLSKKWGTPFGNRERYLPYGNYLEYRVAPPAGTKGAGARRVVENVDTGDLFYTWTHYGDSGDPAFLRIK